MRLLVDENLSLRVADALRDAGHEAMHVIDAGLRNATDEVILRAADRADQVIVTADTDFGTLLARSGAPSPSVVTLRSSDHLRLRNHLRLRSRPISSRACWPQQAMTSRLEQSRARRRVAFAFVDSRSLLTLTPISQREGDSVV